MSNESVWQAFFDAHAPYYMQNEFTRNTAEEVQFVIEELRLIPPARILDVGCGTGRHSTALAQRGFRVTGVDLSRGMLREAKAAAKAGVSPVWVQGDATRLPTARFCDAAICLCEGAFGLLGLADDPHEHDLDILRSVYRSLLPGGRFILTAPNGLAKIRQYSQEDVEAGTFDPLTLVETVLVPAREGAGAATFRVRERGHLPGELARWMAEVGFSVEHVWGGTAGAWRKQPPRLDEMELMVIAHKPSE